MIDKELLKLISNFESATGKRPLGIYLGSNQCNALKDWANNTLGFCYRKLPPKPEFYGINVYEVNEEYHINVG